MSALARITDWKQFERFCADLLECEGFLVQSEPRVDRTGIDIRAVEEYRSHDPNRVIRVHWRVQCKHFALSGTNLGRKEVEEALFSFEATRTAEEGLFLFVSTDYTEPAKEVVDRYIASHQSAKVTLWNQRQIIARLDRHPHLSRRYGISRLEHDYVSSFSELSIFAPRRILMLSDQSPLAHNLSSCLRRLGFEIVFLSVWNYSDPLRLALMLEAFEESSIGLMILFLGDSFSLRMPTRLIDYIQNCHRRGTPLLLYPFLAWSIHRKLYDSLTDICPVALIDPRETMPRFVEPKQIVGDSRRGDFRWLLKVESFAEDQYVEYDPLEAKGGIADDVKGRFGLSHSFEYLTPRNGSEVLWADTSGNPFIVALQSQAGKICYVNTCCHACMSPIAISSPLEASQEFGIVQRNVIKWLLKD